MLDRKKILLLSNSLFGQGNSDMFLNVNLSRTYKEIKPQIYRNEFDIQANFDNERNSSRNFYLYGIIDSPNTLSDLTTGFLYTELLPPVEGQEDDLGIISSTGNTISLSSGALLQLNQSFNITDLGFEKSNNFGIKRKKYLIELENFNLSGQSVVYIYLPKRADDNLIIPDQIFRQVLVYYDEDGNFVPYGQDRIELRSDGTFFTVSNDFPFMYNIHWIKNDLIINKYSKGTVQFELKNFEIAEGESKILNVSLDEPSKLGLEVVDLLVLSGGTAVPFVDFDYSPKSLSWAEGEITQQFTATCLTNSVLAQEETFSFVLSGNSEVVIGTNNVLNGFIDRSSTTSFATFYVDNFMYNYNTFGNTFSGTGAVISSSTQSANLLDGYLNEKDKQSFYRPSQITVSITNNNEDVLIPNIPILNIQSAILHSGGTISGVYQNTFSGATLKHSVAVLFQTGVTSPMEGVIVNGDVFPTVSGATSFSDRLGGRTNKDYTYEVDLAYDTGNGVYDLVLLQSTREGIPVVVDTTTPFAHSNIIILENGELNMMQPFQQRPQNPFSIPLYANGGSGLSFDYTINFGLIGLNSTLSVDINKSLSIFGSVNYYLSTSYSAMNIPYSASSSSCLLGSDILTTQNTGSTTYYGALLLSSPVLNATIYTGGTFVEVEDFVPSCTTNLIPGGFIAL